MASRRNVRRRDREAARAKVRGAAGSTLVFLGRLVAASLVVAGTFAGVIAVYLWATSTPRFAVTDVRVQGNHQARLSELVPLIGIRRGTNVFLVDTAQAAARIESHPWVASASVRRELPSRVVVTVREHRAVALVSLGALYLVGEHGEIFKRAVPGDPMDLPVITGIATPDTGTDPAATRSSVAQALAVIARWRASSVARRARLSEVHLDPVQGASVTASMRGGDGTPFVAHLGHGDLDRRLDRLDRLCLALSRRGQVPSEVFLDNHARPQWVVARVDPSAAPTSEGRPHG